MENIEIYYTYTIILLLPILSIILSKKLYLLKTYFNIKLSIIILCFYVVEFFGFRIINVSFNTNLLMLSYIVVIAIVNNLIFRRFSKKIRRIIASIVFSFYYLIILLLMPMIWLLGDLYSEVNNIRIDDRYIIGTYNTGNFAHSNVECELVRKYSFGVIYRIVDSCTFYGEHVSNIEKIKVEDVSDKKFKVQISIGTETKILTE